MLSDLRFALRSLRRNPVPTAVIVLSLGIGIGANSAIFSVVNALLLKPLPYPRPEQLAVLWLRSPGLGIMQDWPSPGEYIDLKNENRVFEEIAISQGAGMTLTGVDQPEHVEVLRTSSALFRILGAKPQLGRLLLSEDDAPGRGPVAILSDAAWRRLYNRDRGAVNKSIALNGQPYTIVGVLESGFLMNREIMQTIAGTEKMEVYLPLPLAADAVVKQRGDENYNLTGRLKPGVTISQAKADVKIIADRMRVRDKRSPTFTIDVVSLNDQVVGDVRAAVLVLFGSVGLVLAIACANVANLLLSRAAAREKEMAIRTALGAKRSRIARQLFTESLVLGLSGALSGLAIAYAALQVVRAINPGNIPRLDTVGIDLPVLLFTFGMSILTSILFCAAPVARAIAPDVNNSLKSGGRNTQPDGGFSGARHRLRGLLVVSELAISLMLLTGAGLLIRSFRQLREVKPGFNPSHVLSMQLGRTADPRITDGRDSARAQRYRLIYDKIRQLPGVKMVSATGVLPFTPSVGWGGIGVEGYNPPPDQGELQVDLRGVAPRYFETMEAPLLQGRTFADADAEEKAPRTAVIDEKMARRFFLKGDAVGKHIWFDPKQPFEIVGVTGVVKQYGLGADTKMATYFPTVRGGNYMVVRTQGPPGELAAAIGRAVHEVDPYVPVYDVKTMTDRMHDSLARERFSMTMMTAFAVFAMILAAVGVYGALSYMVAQGTHDIGVRVALGASRRDILQMVVSRGMRLAALGIATGVAGAVALTRGMSALLFGISPYDPVTFAGAPLFLAAVGLLACGVPGRRAAAVDPMAALRNE